MNKHKLIAIFLVVLLGIFILHGIFFAISIFMYLLKYMVIAAIIAYVYYKLKGKE